MHTYIDVGSLKLPPVIKKRGRPKGAEKTVIGLPSRKRFKGDQVRKPVSFLKKSTSNKDEGTLIKPATVIMTFLHLFYHGLLTAKLKKLCAGKDKACRRGRCGDKAGANSSFMSG